MLRVIGDGGRHRGNTNTSSQLRTIITLRWNTYTFRYDFASPLATRQREDAPWQPTRHGR